MAHTIQAQSKAGTRAVKPIVAKGMKQASKLATNNADLQAALVTNSERHDGPNVLVSNPVKSLRKEGGDIHDQVRTRIKEQLDDLKGMLDPLAPPMLTSLAQFAAQGKVLTSFGVTLKAKAADAGAAILKLGMAKAQGWQMHRLTDGWMLKAKFVNIQTAVTTRFRTLQFLISADTATTMADTIVTAASSAHIATSVDEIHRVAETFGLEAKDMVAILQAAAVIRANQKVEIASSLGTVLSAGTTLELKAGVSIKQSAKSHTFTDGLGGSITIMGGMVHINPLLAAGADLPVIVPPVVPLTPTQLPGPVKTVPQYEGMNAHDTAIVG